MACIFMPRVTLSFIRLYRNTCNSNLLGIRQNSIMYLDFARRTQRYDPRRHLRSREIPRFATRVYHFTFSGVSHIKSFFTDDMVFVGCALPSCPKSSNLVVPLYCSLHTLEGDTRYASYFLPFLEFFVSEKQSDYRCILEIIYISMFMEVILMCDSIEALSLFLAFSVRPKDLAAPK